MNRRLPLVWMVGKETWAELKDANRGSSNPMPSTLLDDNLMGNLAASLANPIPPPEEHRDDLQYFYSLYPREFKLFMQ